MTTHTIPHARIEYTVEVDGQPRKDSYTTADVRDHRPLTDRQAAASYAQHISVERFENADPSTVEVTQVVGPEDGRGVN